MANNLSTEIIAIVKTDAKPDRMSTSSNKLCTAPF